VSYLIRRCSIKVINNYEWTPCEVRLSGCENTAVTYHEPIKGNPGKRISMKHDLQIAVCASCHNRLHREPELDKPYQIEMQLKYMETHTLEEFKELFKTNYL